MTISTLPSKAAEFLFDQVGMTHRFVVQIDHGKYNLGTWSRASGLSVSWAPCHYRSGESNDEHVFPGNVRYTNIKLSRAACTDSAKVKSWLATVIKDHQPLSGSIEMVDFVGLPIITWEIKQMSPVGWNISDFDSAGRTAAIESIEFAHSGFLDDEVTVR